MKRMNKKMRMMLTVTLILGLFLVLTFSQAFASTPVFRGVVYNYDGQYIELTPLQYAQFRGASNPAYKALVINPATTAFRPLQGIVDSRGFVFTVLKYAQMGRNYSIMTENDQVATAAMRIPSTVQIVSGVINLIPRPVAVTGVTLDQPTMNLTVGGATGTLVATVAPANATNKDVTWSSSNPEVAPVANGVVTPVAAGTATITVTTVAGGFTATSVVTVATTTANVATTQELEVALQDTNIQNINLTFNLFSTLFEEFSDGNTTIRQQLLAEGIATIGLNGVQYDIATQALALKLAALDVADSLWDDPDGVTLTFINDLEESRAITFKAEQPQ